MGEILASPQFFVAGDVEPFLAYKGCDLLDFNGCQIYEYFEQQAARSMTIGLYCFSQVHCWNLNLKLSIPSVHFLSRSRNLGVTETFFALYIMVELQWEIFPRLKAFQVEIAIVTKCTNA